MAWTSLALALSCAPAAAQTLQGPRVARRGLDGRPRITTTLAAEQQVPVDRELCFTVTVSDAEFDRVSLRLLAPPPGLVFDPVLDARAPVTVAVRWLVPDEANGRQELVFEATDSHPGRTRLALAVTVLGFGESSGLLTGDVTGDGVLDVVGVAEGADRGGVPNVGALYVWAGASVPSGSPTATLAIAGAAQGDLLGFMGDAAAGQAVQLADVTGDGVLDVVAGAALAKIGGVLGTGAIYVFAGGSGLTGTPAPRATLTTPGQPGSRLGSVALGQGIRLADVSGDGVLDVIAGCERADLGGHFDNGAIFVFDGGAGLTGALGPSASLSVPGSKNGDRLGRFALADVSGDGVLDVVAPTPGADLASTDEGAVYLFRGGASLAGAVGPSATMTVPGALAHDGLGWVRFGDVAGDATLDVVAGTPSAGGTDTGAIYVFPGGAGLAGATSPGATLTVPGALANDRMGNDTRLADVTGDGRPDVVAGSWYADVGGVIDTGAIYVFAGASGLSGAVGPSASLSVPGAAANDRLGDAGSQDSHASDGLQFHDLTGDGVLDMLVAAPLANVGGISNTGAIYLFAGGSALSGAVAPSASLTVPGAAAGDALGYFATDGCSIRVLDVTGDGRLDVVTGGESEDVAGVANAGALYVFSGATLSGAVVPKAKLTVPAPSSNDLLGQLTLLGDVTGDGRPDIVALANTPPGGVSFNGVIYVFAGGSALSGAVTPRATLTEPSADYLGTASGAGILLVDVTGDGVLDVVAGAVGSDVAGATDVGSIHVFAGGSALAGAIGPQASLTVPGASSADTLGSVAFGQGLRCADVTGDGVLDIVAGNSNADVGGVADVGAIRIFSGGAGLVGALAPLASLTVPGAAALDWLGRGFTPDDL